ENNFATKADLKTLEQDLKQHFSDQMQFHIHELRNYIDERTRDMQTGLLRAFEAYEEKGL
ncbi:MAG: hypothetical protein JO097_10295, partial [Acidobacteriaceae bacterium]|nr:hypothetical protein [Acidobacteriaceae bacterium]